MSKKVSQLIRAKMIPAFLIMLLFAVISAYYNVELAIIELLVSTAIIVSMQMSENKRRRDLGKYLEKHEGEMSDAAEEYMVSAPMPTMIFRPESGQFVWCNSEFMSIINNHEKIYDYKVSDIIPGFDAQWLMEGKHETPSEIIYNGKKYRVLGTLVRSDGRTKGSFLATTYWMDVTELANTRDLYHDTKPVMAILAIDNYEDLNKNTSETEKASIRSKIDERLAAWCSTSNAMICRFDRDRYLLLFNNRYLSEYIEKRFTILDTVREVSSPNGTVATVSIGIGMDVDSFEEQYAYSNLALNMALSRGGDQVVIKNRYNFEFYGGRAKEQEKGSKVKNRTIANSLFELIADSSHVFVMGHRSPDYDCVGAEAGICAIARKKGIPAYIVTDFKPNNPDAPLMKKLLELDEYKGCLISSQDAIVMANAQSLLVVVDSNRPEQVLSLELLDSCNRIAVIDHHRRAATRIEGATIEYYDPYASSASEQVSILMNFLLDAADIKLQEAEALYAGIVLDTKNFTMRTGGSTFETAAFLRRCGVDTSNVKKVFQLDLESTVTKYSMIEKAQIVAPGVAMAVASSQASRITASQAADELLNIAGVEASFVVYPEEERVNISGRSLGKINVQIVLEALGGGGNSTTAGAQLENTSIDDVADKLKKEVLKYLE